MLSLLEDIKTSHAKKEIKALLFDVDGTIVDTMSPHYVSWHQALGEFEAKITDEEMKNHRGVTSAHIIEYLNITYGYTLDHIAVSERKETIFAQMQLEQPAVAIAHVIEVIKYGHRQGWQIAACTGGLFENIKDSLVKVKVFDLFEKFFTASDNLKQKTLPDYWSDVARSLQVKPEDCVVLEDSPLCIEAAVRAGMRAFQIEDYKNLSSSGLAANSS